MPITILDYVKSVVGDKDLYTQCHVLQRERMFRAGATLSDEADGVFNRE
jgi:hypothetical protein